MASSGDPEPAWLDADNDPSKEDTPLMGSGDVALQDTEKDVEAAADNAKDAASYGALDIKETTEEDADDTPKQQDTDWHKDKAPAKKKKKSKKKSVRVSESIHEILVNRPHRPWCLHLFIFIEIVAILASFNLLITEIIPVIIAPPSKRLDYLSLALRVYLSCFCLVFISVELEIPIPFIKDSKIFNNWVSRGFLYSFIGLIGMEEAYSSRVESLVGNANDKFHVAWVPMFMQISSWIMFAVGCTYMLLGVCCLHKLRDKLRDSYQERLKEYNSTTVIAAPSD